MSRPPAPSLTTRILHLGLAVGVTLQLLLSTFMDRPKPGAHRTAAQSLGFEAHEVVGLSLLLVTLAWLLWLFLRRGEPGPRELFPWLRAQERGALLAAGRGLLAEARNGRVAAEEEVRPLAQSVHGLGALCALGMASTGTLVWLGMAPSGELAAWAAWTLELHQALAAAMWTYWVAHAGMALLHQWQGEGVLARMFSLRRAK